MCDTVAKTCLKVNVTNLATYIFAKILSSVFIIRRYQADLITE